MRFRLGFVTGFALGYTLGAKAGKERYEQIAAFSRKLSRSDPAQQIQAEVRDVASRAGQALEEKASQGVSRITEYVRGASPGGGAGSPGGGGPADSPPDGGGPPPRLPPS